jgi:hypothetical protein
LWRAGVTDQNRHEGSDPPNFSFEGHSDAGKCPNIDSSDTLAQLFYQQIVWRVPEGVDGLHRRKLEHNNRSRIMLAFEHFHLGALAANLPPKLAMNGTTTSRYF